MMTKRQTTHRQLTNLARGRQILFQNQLRRSGKENETQSLF